MTVYLRVSELALARDDARLCEGVSLTLAQGDCIHLVGPNGSGKTSFLHALCGLLPPEAGTVNWLAGSARSHAHYCGHQDAIKAAWTVGENLRWWIRLQGAGESSVSHTQWDDCLEELRLSALEDTPVGRLSQGEKRRTALARLVLVPRPVWLLDEPFNALDAAAQTQLTTWMNRHTRDGGAILFSSHAGRPPGLDLTGEAALAGRPPS